MSKKIRIGIIGAGNNTQLKHIPGFQNKEGAEVKVVSNRSIGSSRKVAQEFGIPWVAPSWEEVINHSEVDAICIGTPPYLHAEATIAALKKGKHVLVEARMASNLKQAQDMLAVAKQYPELIAQIVPAPYSLDLDSTIQKILSQNFLGFVREIRVIHTQGEYTHPESDTYWRLDERVSGKNMLSLGIIHEMILRWLPIQLEWVMADAMYYTTERKDIRTGLNVLTSLPESLSVLGRLQWGGRLVYEISNVVHGSPVFEVKICGEQGSLHIDLLKGTILKCGSEKDWKVEEVVIIPESSKRGWKVESDFIDSILHKKPVQLTNFEDGVRYMEFTEKVWQSWVHRGERVGF